MADDKNITDGRDRARVDSHDPSEVEYLHKQFPNLSHDQVIMVIKESGPLRTDIERELELLNGSLGDQHVVNE